MTSPPFGPTSSSVTDADGHARYVPEYNDRDLAMRIGHESRYEWVAEQWDLSGMRVVDFGCGSGYGAARLARDAAEVVGLDLSPTAVEYADKTYGGDHGRFVVADLCAPLPTDVDRHAFDLVVSSEVIEHVPDVFAFLDNLRSLLTPDGIAVVGTPNRRWSYRQPGGALLDPSHVMELTPEHLHDLLSLYFTEVQLFAHEFPPALRPSGSTDTTTNPSTAGFPQRLGSASKTFIREVMGPDRIQRWAKRFGALSSRPSADGQPGETITDTQCVYTRASPTSELWEHEASMGQVAVGSRPIPS